MPIPTDNLLITGTTGFLGRHVIKLLGASSVLTLGRDRNNKLKCDLAIEVPGITKPVDTVIHLAGKAHSFPKSQLEKDEFFNVNLQGTKNLIKGFRGENIPQNFIFISSVAVYGMDSGENISEIFPCKGSSPYALSKLHAEDYILDWGAKNNVNIYILRLPLVVGSCPPGNLGAMIKTIKSGLYFRIGNGEIRKSMVLAVDVAKLVLNLKGKPAGIYNLTDGYHPTFKEIDSIIAKTLNKKIISLPSWFVKTIAKIGDAVGNKFPLNTDKYVKLSSTLTFNDSKARELLDWKPQKVIDKLHHYVNC